MSSEWLDDIFSEDIDAEGIELEPFYCPYTNGAQCALLTKGWEPQELCSALECDQLTIFQRSKARRRHKAA